MATTSTNESGYRAFQATAVALEQFVRVTVDSAGLISVAGESDLGVGVTQEAVAASGWGTVKLWSAPGTFHVQAGGPVTRGAQLYAAASGEVDDSGTYKLRLVALEAAAAQGDVIEVAVVQDATYGSGNYVSTDVAALTATGSAIGNAAQIVAKVSYATGDDTVGVKLPNAVAGLVYEVYNLAATAGLKVYPAANDDINDGTTNAAVVLEGKTLGRFVALDGVTWAAQFTANS
jgi:hypothetical protein